MAGYVELFGMAVIVTVALLLAYACNYMEWRSRR